jgi:hypothetical protein
MSVVSDEGSTGAAARLVETSGRAHEVTGPEAVVGRGTEASVQIDHADISRMHARLTVGEDGVEVEDLGSKNGVFVNGIQVDGAVHAVDGDLLGLGAVELRLVHPASRVRRLLAARGEATHTRARAPTAVAPAAPGLAVPLIGVAVFAALVAAMLLL